MIIYITDRLFNITGQASTSLPGGLRITEDLLTEDVDSGVNIFDFTITHEGDNRKELEEAVKVGNFVLRSGGRSDSDEGYNSIFQVLETEYDTLTHEMHVYAEDAGLDLINRTCGAVALKKKTLDEMLKYFVPAGWSIVYDGTFSGTKSNEWTGESTVTDRILSVANLWGAEVYYTFLIDNMMVTARRIHITPHRGTDNAVAQLRLNQHINKITTKTSIADLATGLVVTGGIPTGKTEAINLKNYTYSYTDSNGDVFTVDKTTGQMRCTTAMKRWASFLDTDGLILNTFDYQTTSQATLAGQARAALQKVCGASVEYEVDFVELNDDIKIGDRINIIDEAGELYLEARLLHIESSVTDYKISATIGEYVLKSSGIDESVQKIAADLAKNYAANVVSVTVRAAKSDSTPAAELTATVFYNSVAISDVETFATYFTDSQYLQWYMDGTEIDGANGFTYTADLTSGTKYTCKIVKDEEGE